MEVRMEELKTLNDMCFPAGEIKQVDNDELKILTYHQVREEAIKWIKANAEDGRKEVVMREIMQARNVWIQHFFNITDKELTS